MTTTTAMTKTPYPTATDKRRVSYFYDIEIGNYHYGQGIYYSLRALFYSLSLLL